MNAKEVQEIPSVMEIYHPYGSVGKLLTLTSDVDSVGFGEEPDPIKLINIAGQIKTFTEGTDEVSSQISAIRGNLLAAARVVFLGFAFHPLNMDLLMPQRSVDSSLRDVPFLGTAHNVSVYNKNVIVKDVNTRFGAINILPKFVLEDHTCTDFFNEYWRGLSFV